MRLHLVNDEKIINRTIEMFESVYPNDNLFVVVNRTKSAKWVKSAPNVMLRSEFLKSKNKYTFSHLFIHLLNMRKINIINQLSLYNIPTYWIIWGLDLYNNLLSQKGFPMVYSDSDFVRRKSILKKIGEKIQLLQKKHKARKIIDFVERHVNYIVTDTTENDYDYLLKYYPALKNKTWKDFFYYPIDVILGKTLMSQELNGNNIMIGNSASMSNNHEYAMNFLSKLNIGNRKVYVPLSYSGKRNYTQYVINKGELLFGENFNPLLNFIPLDKYNVLQQSINVVLYGNWRQEAIGNILISLYLGAKVFLSKQNPVYEWALGHELKVFVLEDITQQQIDLPLPEIVKISNRTILKQLYNQERLEKLIRDF